MPSRDAIVSVIIRAKCACGNVEELVYETPEDIAKLDTLDWNDFACMECV